MEVEFDDSSLLRLASDASYDAGYDRITVKTFRMRVQLIRAAEDERAFYQLKSLHFERLQGGRQGQSSMRLNDQWRLILRFRKKEDGKVVVIMSITDYH